MCFSQTNNTNIHAVVERTDDSVKLRWMPTSYGIWQKGIANGYRITRVNAITNSTIVLSEELKPIKRSDFDSTFPNNPAAQSAKMMLYDMTINTAPAQLNSLKDVLDKKEQNEGRHLFAMISAEKDFEVAEAMALGYTDNSIYEDDIYIYRVEINNDPNDSSTPVSSSYIESNLDDQDLGQVTTLITKIDHKVAVLSWDIEEFDQVYSAWNIEKSFDGSNYTKINNAPFIHGYTEEAYEFLASYQDPLPPCEGDIYYRVQGITPFGSEGPYSNITDIECVSKPIRIPFTINGSQEKGDEIVINWSTFDKVFEDSIKGFNVYRTPELTKEIVKLNNNLIPKFRRRFQDKEPLPSGYYFLEIIDINDMPHRSSEFFVQKSDDTPPAIPTQITGNFTSSQTLQIRWSRNTEPDFKGCDVLMANDRNANFTKNNQKYIEGKTYDLHFNKQLETDSVFVKIRALDIFYNPSEYSQIYAFARPDVWAPSSPILEFAYPTPKGVALGWSYSGSDDVTKHKVQKKYSDDYNWKDILIISKENIDKFPQTIETAISDQLANHVDNHKIEARSYDYRIVAYDDAGNKGTSKVLSLVPFSTQEMDLVKNFNVQIVSQHIEPSDEMKTQINNLNSPQKDEQLEALTKTKIKANLTWTCELSEDISGFIIYRSYTRESFKPIKECSLAQALGLEDSNVNVEGNLGRKNMGYVDADLKKGYRYSYYVVAKLTNGAESLRSEIITKVVQ